MLVAVERRAALAQYSGGGMKKNVTPLHVLLSVMRQKWDDQDLDGAVALAKIAAPYLHAKVSAARPAADLSGASDDELDRFERGGGASASNEDPGEPA
jgi:hypothetical protein